MIDDMARMNILLFIYSYRGGGAEKMMVTIGNELHRRGHEVKQVAVSTDGPHRSKVDSSIQVIEIGGTNLFEIQCKMWMLIQNSESDVLLSTMEIPNIVSIIASRFPTSIPTILRIASIYSSRERKGKYRFIPALKRLVYPRAEQIISISDAVGRDISEQTGVSRERVDTIYNPAYKDEIPVMMTEPVSHEWVKKKRVVIAVGNFKPAKDYPTLIRAINHLQQWKETHLIILGNGDRRKEMITLAEELGIRKRVSFPGFVDNPYAYIAKSDVFVLSSAWEGFGNVVVEAMGCGTPVVCTDCPGGPSEILDDGTYGPLVPVGDSQALADAIQRMFINPTCADKLKSRAEDFSIESVVDKYETVMGELVYN
jgi:glycosyltransferase involved in cell wall biosynthesis